MELRIKGFNNVFMRYSREYYVMHDFCITNENSKGIIRDLYYLELVCAWYPGKADCIHKTLIGYKILGQKYNVNLEMVVGLRKKPFEAHAWLRHKGISLIDEDDDANYKVVLSSKKYIGID